MIPAPALITFRNATLALAMIGMAMLPVPAATGQQYGVTLPGGLGSGSGVGPGGVGPGGFAPSAEEQHPVQVTARIAPAEGDRPAVLLVRADLAPGYHVYSLTQPEGGPAPTKILATPPAGVTVGDFRPGTAPESHIDTEIWQGLRIEEHTGVVTWFAPISVAAGVDPASVQVSGVVDTQACKANSCEPLRLPFAARPTTAALPASIAALVAPATANPFALPGESGAVEGGEVSPAPTDPGADDEPSLLAVLGAALVGGLILNLMPCVLPVIGLKVLSFAEQAGHDRGKVLAMNLAYVAGLMSVFMLLACLTAFAGYGWGELNTHAEFKIGVVVLVFAMALSFLGVWEIPIPGFAGGKEASSLQQKEGYGGAFFKACSPRSSPRRAAGRSSARRSATRSANPCGRRSRCSPRSAWAWRSRTC